MIFFSIGEKIKNPKSQTIFPKVSDHSEVEVWAQLHKLHIQSISWNKALGEGNKNGLSYRRDNTPSWTTTTLQWDVTISVHCPPVWCGWLGASSAPDWLSYFWGSAHLADCWPRPEQVGSVPYFSCHLAWKKILMSLEEVQGHTWKCASTISSLCLPGQGSIHLTSQSQLHDQAQIRNECTITYLYEGERTVHRVSRRGKKSKEAKLCYISCNL